MSTPEPPYTGAICPPRFLNSAFTDLPPGPASRVQVWWDASHPDETVTPETEPEPDAEPEPVE